MTPAVVLIAIFAYFIVLFGISYIVGHRADNQGFLWVIVNLLGML